MPLGGAPESLDAPVPEPARWFGEALKTALASQGILVQGGVRVVAWPETPAWPEADLYKLGELQSPPLRDIVRSFMKVSQNLETDLVFEHVGELTREPGTPPWVTSEDLAVRALDKFLARQGVPADVHFDEGSGLSRNNLTSADATAALLTVMATNRWAADYFAALPIAGGGWHAAQPDEKHAGLQKCACQNGHAALGEFAFRLRHDGGGRKTGFQPDAQSLRRHPGAAGAPMKWIR